MRGSTTFQAVSNGWAIPTATDIAFSYLIGRIVFGAGHPAVRFLLLLAIADDAAGLLILAVFCPTGEIAPQWLFLSIAAAVGVFILANGCRVEWTGESRIAQIRPGFAIGWGVGLMLSPGPCRGTDFRKADCILRWACFQSFPLFPMPTATLVFFLKKRHTSTIC
ncbi:Na+/H+ antiporter NhaA [Ruegeria lacuscaerulensis]|uniref:Na+/H+ antiporter NhaA n=1 Tax=Ruegeria lacuscaerulensis TaxID=55218 RepID=UPI0030138C45